MTLNQWRTQVAKISYYTLGQMLGYKGLNPATNAQRICLTVTNDKRFPKPNVVKKILEITKGKVGYEDLYKAYYEATDK